MAARVDREIVVKAAVAETVGVVAKLAGRWVALELVVGAGCREVVLEVAIDATIHGRAMIEVRSPPLRCAAVAEFAGRRVSLELMIRITGGQEVLEVTLRAIARHPSVIKLRRAPITGGMAVFARLGIAFEQVIRITRGEVVA